MVVEAGSKNPLTAKSTDSFKETAQLRTPPRIWLSYRLCKSRLFYGQFHMFMFSPNLDGLQRDTESTHEARSETEV